MLAAIVAVLALVACSPSPTSTSPGPSADSPAPTSPSPAPDVSPSTVTPSPTTPPTAATPTSTPVRPTAPTRTPTTTPTRTPTLTRTPSPTSPIPAALAGHIVTTIPTSAKVVALTFDAGASAAGVPSILATLSASGVSGTFFPTGAFARSFPDQVRAFAVAGHAVGNHSDSHPDFTTLTGTQQVAQLTRAEAEIRPLSGRTTRPWFRFPYGASTTATITTVNGEGYACLGWTVDTLGWQGTSGGRTVESVVQRVTSTLRPGLIVLMHVGAHPQDGTTLDADALPRIISELRARGYGFVAVEAALG